MDRSYTLPSREALRKSLNRVGKSFTDLANEVNLSRDAFSRKLNHNRNRSFDRQEALRLIKILVEWDIVTSQQDAHAWFVWLGYDQFTYAERTSLAAQLPTPPSPAIPTQIPRTTTSPPLQRPPRVQYFTGRTADLDTLLAELKPGRVVTLCGPGGIGKSALAAEAIWQLAPGSAPPQQFLDGIIFHSFYHQPSAEIALDHIARSLGEEPRPTPTSAALRVLANKRLLLVLDGAEEADNLPAVLAVRGASTVLVTSRRREDAEGNPQDVLALALTESIALFRAWAGRHAQGKVVCRTICTLLGGLPLAIRLAGHYLSTQREAASTYLQRLQDTPLAALDQGKRQHHSVPIVLERSVQRLSVPARELLELIGLLAAAPFNRTLITALVPNQDDSITRALDELVTYSLLWQGGEQYEVSHALIHMYARDQLGATADPLTRRNRITQVVRSLDTHFPPTDYAHWPECNALVPHVQALLYHHSVEPLLLPEGIQLFQRTGTYLCEQARFEEARLLLEAARTIAERLYGSEHLASATTLHALACLADVQGRYVEAEDLYQRTLHNKEQALGPDHIEVASTLHALAGLYDNQGRYAEAEALYQRVLRIRSQVPGLDPADVVTTLNELAWLYDRQGRYAEGATFLRKVLVQAEEALGKQHPIVAFVLHTLACLVEATGASAEAEQIYDRALQLKEQAFGPDHPEVATTLHNLGRFYDGQGRYRQAEPLLQRALRIKEQALGPNHPEVAFTLNNLARLYSNVSKYEAADPLFRRSLAIKEQALGVEHPSVAFTLNNLARMYAAQGKVAEAESLFQRTLAIREHTIGPDHPDVAITLEGLAELYWQQSQYANAELYLRRALAIREQVLGSDHPDTQMTRQWLADLSQHSAGKLRQDSGESMDVECRYG